MPVIGKEDIRSAGKISQAPLSLCPGSSTLVDLVRKIALLFWMVMIEGQMRRHFRRTVIIAAMPFVEMHKDGNPDRHSQR